MSTPKTFTKQSVTASPDEDVLQIKDTEGNIISWIDSNGIPAGNMAPGTSVVLETNGVHNGSQSLLNLSAGNNITLTDNGAGTVTIASQTQTIPANGLIAEYKFDQGLGSVLVD